MKISKFTKKSNPPPTRPQICVCISGKNQGDIFHQINALPVGQFDMIEWRADHFSDLTSISAVHTVLRFFRQQLQTVSVLFTCRDINEGGFCSLPYPYRIMLFENIILTGMVDLIDLELKVYESDFAKLKTLAKNQNVLVIASYHVFTGQPRVTEMQALLHKMEMVKADIAKLAVMPKNDFDLISLLSFSEQYRGQKQALPLVLIGMGDTGRITRLGCDLFHSPLVYCAYQTITAPGQISVNILYRLLTTLIPD